MAHWPEVVRKMAAHLKGLVEGVLKKKVAEERHEQAKSYAQAADSDLIL